MVMETTEIKTKLPKEYSGYQVNSIDWDVPKDVPEGEENIIRSKYWELPESSLQGWRPFTAFIDYRLFLGPQVAGSYGKGFGLHKDLLGGIHGSRGSGKSEFLSFLLAKKMRSGKPVWSNYPISFFVVEADGSLTYYESMPLDLNKFYAFSPLVRNGAVGITELQYYVEARTSGKAQNRVAGYQIMQIRKTALSFLYDVQDRRWVDKRFGWSNDFDLECTDISKLSYDRKSIQNYPPKVLDEHGNLREGAYVRFFFEDASGFATGIPFSKFPKSYGPYQFAGHNFWDIYPTYFIIDAYEAMNSYKAKNEKQEARDFLANALEMAIDIFLKSNEYEVVAADLWRKAEEIAGGPLDHRNCGRQISEWGIPKRQVGKRGAWAYNLGVLLENGK